jgi:hypothetical protein
MDTISSINSLLTWKHTNGWGNHGANLQDAVPEDFLKEDYLNVFSILQQYAESDVKKLKFTDAWQKVCKNACNTLANKLKSIANVEQAGIVISKFRGNLGEIMAEKIFSLFGSMWDIAPESYKTVDPENEMFLDAQGVHISDRMQIGIQVKNYSVHPGKTNAVGWEVFTKSMAMTTYWLQCSALVKPEDADRFLSIPRQIIFSFTPVSYDIIADNYKKAVRFIGPAEIEKLDLQHKGYVFKQIVDEITLL